MRRHHRRSLPERLVTQCPGTCCSRRSTTSSPYGGWVGSFSSCWAACLPGRSWGLHFEIRVVMNLVTTPVDKYLPLEHDGRVEQFGIFSPNLSYLC